MTHETDSAPEAPPQVRGKVDRELFLFCLVTTPPSYFGNNPPLIVHILKICSRPQWVCLIFGEWEVLIIAGGNYTSQSSLSHPALASLEVMRVAYLLYWVAATELNLSYHNMGIV